MAKKDNDSEVKAVMTFKAAQEVRDMVEDLQEYWTNQNLGLKLTMANAIEMAIRKAWHELIGTKKD